MGARAAPLICFALALWSAAEVDATWKRKHAHKNFSSLHNEGANKMKIELVYEALCPFCKEFLTKQVQHVMKSDLKDFIELRLYPYGNAYEPAKGVFQCQHGKDECKLNKIAACGIKELQSDSKETVEFISCLEDVSDPVAVNWHQCLVHAEPKKHEIELCASSSKGLELLHEVGLYAKSFKYEYVPWVMVDGSHEKGAEENFTGFLCDRLGRQKPRVCTLLSLLDSKETFKLKPNERCYPEKH